MINTAVRNGKNTNLAIKLCSSIIGPLATTCELFFSCRTDQRSMLNTHKLNIFVGSFSCTNFRGQLWLIQKFVTTKMQFLPTQVLKQFLWHCGLLVLARTWAIITLCDNNNQLIGILRRWDTLRTDEVLWTLQFWISLSFFYASPLIENVLKTGVGKILHLCSNEFLKGQSCSQELVHERGPTNMI